MLGLTDIRKGKVIELEEFPYLVVAAQFTRKQKSRPVVRATLKNLVNGSTKDHTFQQADKVVEADMEKKACQFLYQQGDDFLFMDQSTYEQLEISLDTISDIAELLLEGQEVDISFFKEQPVSVDLPIKIERKIIQAPPGVRGDTSSNVMKEAVIEGGARIKVPLFVDEGDVIRLDTRTGEYAERV